MGFRINTNTTVLTAQRNMETQTRAEESSSAKLSSGSRIARAGDDAAGLSISETMRADYRSMNQAVRNSNDGISMVQVAEGALGEIMNMLVRMRELSIQSASDTVGNSERSYGDREIQQLKAEIGRIANITEYNGHKLLATGPDYMEIQSGLHNNPDEDRLYYDVWKGNTTPEKLGITNLSISTKEQARENLSVIDQAISQVSKNRAGFGALQSRMASAASNGSIYAENLAAAGSRIKDADMALETAEATKNRILANSSLSVLSQCNQNDKLALKLLG